MRRWTSGAAALLSVLVAAACTPPGAPPDPAPPATPSSPAEAVALPEARSTGEVPLEQAIAQRRSVRDFTDEPLALADAAQLLWAAQGITSRSGGRTAPSAGGLHPLQAHLVAGDVSGLAAGVYRYRPATHDLVLLRSGDTRAGLARASLDQSAIAAAPASLVLAADPSRTEATYGTRADRYVAMEAGHAAQNVYLQATALGLGTVCMGAFTDDAVRRILGLAAGVDPLYVMPVGHSRGPAGP